MNATTAPAMSKWNTALFAPGATTPSWFRQHRTAAAAAAWAARMQRWGWQTLTTPPTM